ncbi:MAG TPA: DUF3887 domain-containing protein [Anaerolineales bacterium]|nr:DUF3887 domain-containing protein [Anaerolineales bacterium]
MKTKLSVLFVLSIIAVLIAGCGSAAPTGPVTSALTEEQAREIAIRALTNGYNNDDRDAYVVDMDDSMRSAITADAFVNAIKPYKDAYGNFVSIETAELSPANTSGYVRWTFTSKFEKGTLYFLLVFPEDGKKVTGAFLNEVKP